MEPTKLYRHWNKEGELLYVGISVNAIGRLAGHNIDATWADEIEVVTIETFPTREAAEAAETKAIQEEDPIHNIKKRGSKVVRDGFCMLHEERAMFEDLRLRVAQLGRLTNKSELIRAGLYTLASLPNESLTDSLDALPTVIRGRPAA